MNHSDTVMMRLTGHQPTFPLTPGAHQLLLNYLADARRALARDVDQDESLRDLEVSIGDYLASSPGDVISENLMRSTLERIGPASPEHDTPASAVKGTLSPGLRRIEEGKWLTGLCNGIATAQGFSVAWVRGIYVLISFLAGGLLAPLGSGYLMMAMFGLSILVYLGLSVFLQPVTTRAEYDRLRTLT